MPNPIGDPADQRIEGIAGVDEAGRGPWAGPVTVAAAMLTEASAARLHAAGVNDSKTLTRKARERCFDLICEEQVEGRLWLAVETAEVPEIDHTTSCMRPCGRCAAQSRPCPSRRTMC